MGEIDFSVQHSFDVFVFGELGSVVGGDGDDVVLKRPEQLDDEFCHSFGVLVFRGLGHEEFLSGTLDPKFQLQVTSATLSRKKKQNLVLSGK